MADPVLGLPELLQGDPSAYIRQNNRNLVDARLAGPLLAATAAQNTVPTPVVAGEMYLVGVGTFTTTTWAGVAEDDLAIALSNDPVSGEGWAFITPIKGMTYHDGTDAKMWTGADWTTVELSGAVIPDPFVFVRYKSDLPTPAAGVITLVAGYTYMFLAEVDLTGDRLVLGANTVLSGTSSENARIKSTGLTGTALITSAFSCPMRDIAIEADVALSLVTADNTQAIDWRAVNFVDCPTVGLIEGFGNVIISDSAFLESANLTFDGTIGTIGIDACLMNGRSAQTTIILPATLTVTRRFRAIYSAFVTLTGETGISVDASATIPVEGYILDTVSFSGGSSSYTSGVAFDDNKSLWVNCSNVSNSASIASAFMVGNATATAVVSVDTPLKVAGTTTAGAINQKFTHTSNRLTYGGMISRSFRLTATASFTGGNNKVFSFYFYKDGVKLAESEVSATTNGTGKSENVTIQSIEVLTNGEYIEVYIENNTDAADPTVSSMNMIIEALN